MRRPDALRFAAVALLRQRSRALVLILAGEPERHLGAAAHRAGGGVREVSFALSKGEHLLVTGANGSGKSTLLAVLAGNLTPTSGTVTLPGASDDFTVARGHRARRRRRVGLLSQQVSIPDPHGRGRGRTAAQAYADTVGEELAEGVPLSSFGLLEPRDLSRPLSSLSVGQQRRVQLAGLLADPRTPASRRANQPPLPHAGNSVGGDIPRYPARL